MKIVVEIHSTPNIYHFSEAPELRIYALQDFPTDDGETVLRGAVGGDGPHLKIQCTLDGNRIVIPAFEIDSNSIDPPSYYTAIFKTNGRMLPFLSNFRIPAEPESTTWGSIRDFQRLGKMRYVNPPLAELQQIVSSMIANALTVRAYGNQNDPGAVALSVDPDDPIFPTAVAINDPDYLALLDAAGSGSAAQYVNASAYGVVGDAVGVEDAVMSLVTPTTLTSASSAFTSALVGKSIAVAGAGAAGATLVTTISAVPSPTTLTLATGASTAVTNARTVYGTNNTTPLQDALTAASTDATARTVLLPKGNFLFPEGSLTIPQEVTLQGSWEFAADHMGYRFADEPKPMSGRGTTLVITANEGTATGRFIFLNSDSALRGVSMFWPANTASLTTPKVYPWAVEMFGAGPTVENVEIVNPYQGIYSHIGYRHRVANVKGTPLLTGLYTSQLLGVSHFENIVFEAIYTFADPESGAFPMTALMQWVHQNCTAFKIGRVDAALFYNCFSFACFKGFKFVIDAAETTTFANGTGAPGGKAWAQFISCGADTASYPVDIDDVAGSSSSEVIGVTFTDCVFAASQWFSFAGPPLNAIYARSTFTGRIGLVNCRFHLGSKLVVTEGVTGGGRINLVGCYFQTWTTNAISLTVGTIALTGCTFKTGSASPVIVIAGGAWVSASGNVFEYLDQSVWSLAGATGNFNESGNTYADGPKWTNVTYQNGWASLPGFQGVSYKLQDGRVYLRGTAQSGVVALGTPVFTLPVGHRPPLNTVFAMQSNSAFGVLSVEASGLVSVAVGSNVSITLDGLSFAIR